MKRKRGNKEWIVEYNLNYKWVWREICFNWEVNEYYIREEIWEWWALSKKAAICTAVKITYLVYTRVGNIFIHIGHHWVEKNLKWMNSWVEPLKHWVSGMFTSNHKTILTNKFIHKLLMSWILDSRCWRH